MNDHCAICGPSWPAVACDLCLLCLERAIEATRTLLGVIDTREDLADLGARRDWVLATQLAATRVADYVMPPMEVAA